MRDVSDVVEDFKALAARVARHRRLAERDLAQMYEMLPTIRQTQRVDGRLYGPKDIEELSLGQIPRDTASRRAARRHRHVAQEG